jgi:hypothetical protein
VLGFLRALGYAYMGASVYIVVRAVKWCNAAGYCSCFSNEGLTFVFRAVLPACFIRLIGEIKLNFTRGFLERPGITSIST